MRVWMTPNSQTQPNESGGIATLVRAYAAHAEAARMTFVDDPDQADVWAVHAGAKTGLRGKPVVAHVHGLYWTAENILHEAWHTEVNQAVLESIREAHVVTVPSQWVARSLQRELHLDPVVLGHGINAQQISSTEPSGHYVLWNKNRIGDACTPDAVGVLARRFPERAFHTTLWNQSKLPNVHVLGLLDHTDMLRTVERAFLYLSTAKETFGIGTLEALAAGVPVLGWAEGGNLDLVAHKQTGYLAQPGNYEDLVAGYRWLEANRMRMRDACRRSVQGYSWYVVMRRLRRIYQQAQQIFAERAERKVTVIVPAFNKGATLARTLDSVLAQTLPAAEILVIDNNSTDHTAQLVETYAERGVTYVLESKQGVAYARNRGLALAQSPYVCCLDADDALAPTFLDTCVQALVNDPTLGVAYTRLLTYVNGEPHTVSDWPAAYNFDAFLEKRNQVPTCTVMRTDVARRLGGYRQRYAPLGAGAEDAEFYLRMGARGYRARLVSDEPLFWYSLGTGITSQPDYREVDWTAWHPWTQPQQRALLPAAAPRVQGSGWPRIRSYSTPQVSVVIPCGGHHLSYVADALDSLEAQTHVHWEAIVVLDFKEHEYEEPVAWLKTAYPFVQWLYGPRKGAGAARNAGALEARAPFLLFLDADDFLRPDALRMLLAEQDGRTEPAIVYSDYVGHAYVEASTAAQLRQRGRLLHRDERDGYTHIAYEAYDYDCERAVQQPQRVGSYIWCLVSALVPRVYHTAIGGFDEEMESWEDWDYWVRMARAGFCFARVPHRLMDYRFYSGTRRESGIHLAESLIQYLQEKYAGEKPMPCGSCGRRRASAVAQDALQTPTRLALPEFQGVPMSSQDMVLVRLNDHNIGTHPIVGAVTRTMYGYRAHGDELMLARVDYELRRDLFVLLEEPLPPDTLDVVHQVAPPAEGTLGALEGMTPVLLRALEASHIHTLADVTHAAQLDDVAGMTAAMRARIVEAAGLSADAASVAAPAKRTVGRPKGSTARP